MKPVVGEEAMRCVARWVPRDATMSEVGDMFDERRWEMPLIDTEIMAGVRGVVLLRVSPVAGACSIGRGACSVICERRTAHSG